MAFAYNSQLDAFELYHQVQANRNAPDSNLSASILPALGHAISGSAGSAISNLVTYPLDLIVTRLQIQHVLRKDPSQPSEGEYKGFVDAVNKIYENEGGLNGFYAGVVQDTGKTIADSFFFFLAYTYLRQGRLSAKDGAKSLPALEELSVGFTAGAFTKLLTTPIANIVTRAQAAAFTTSSSDDASERSPSTSQIAHRIYSENGLSGFWSGYSASLVLTLNPSITFFLFEFLKKLVLPRSKREHPSPAVTFLLAAVSKAAASAVTYPFSLAKSRVQTGKKKVGEDERKVVESDVKSKGERKAVQATIFSTLLTIAQTEGVGALYEGLSLELTKAFFSHGITMLVKQAIQRFVVRAYYMLAVLASRYRRRADRRQLAQRLKQRALKDNVEYFNLGIARVGDRLQEAADVMKSRANETAEFVAGYVEEESGEWKKLYGETGLAEWLDKAKGKLS